MKIAIPTDDGIGVAPHFGRSAAFLVFDVQGGVIASRETRSNTGCGSHSAHQPHGRGQESGSHSHAGVLSALADCSVVICSGIGDGAVQALRARGVRLAMVDPAPAEALVSDYLAGRLVEAPASSCHCQH